MSLGISYAGYRTGFPFVIQHKSANGLPFELWLGVKTNLGSPAADSGADVYGFGTYHPIGMTIGQLAELFWRIKSLNVVYDYTFYWDGGGGSITAAGSGVEALIRQSPDPVTSEAFLIGEGPMEHYRSEILTTVGTSEIGVYYHSPPAASDFTVWKIGDLYYPSIRVGMGGLWTRVGSGTEGGRIEDPVSGLTVDFLGLASLPLWGDANLATVSKPPPYSGTGTITVAGSDFWPYGGKFDPADGTRA
jgi:hypothetical protein